MRTRLRFLPMLLLAWPWAQPCQAELTELQVESAYVFNFIKFVEWPATALQPGDKLRLCVVGNEGLRASLAQLDGRKVGEFQLQVAAPAREALKDCQALFIGGSEQHRAVAIIKSLGDAPVLTISDIPGFAERGGGIGLLRRDNKVLFEINLASARKAGLHLSSQMLNLSANIFGR